MAQRPQSLCFGVPLPPPTVAVLAALLATLALASPVAAQTPERRAAQADSNWTRVAVGVSVGSRVGAPFAGAWDASAPTLGVRAEATAYGGRFRAEVARTPYVSVSGDFPAFVVNSATLGWGLRRRLGPVAGEAGARVGAARFSFDDPSPTSRGDETEAIVGGWIEASVRLGGPVRAWLGADADRAALADPEWTVAVRGGLSVEGSAPRWLRTVLR